MKEPATPSLEMKPISETACAGIVFGETSVLEGDVIALAEARRYIAGVAYKRNGGGVSRPKIPSNDELKNPVTKTIWEKCVMAANDATKDDVQNCRHFVVWPSDDAGKTPSSSPKRMPANWPYDYSAKKSWGPFKSNVPPKFMAVTYERQDAALDNTYENIYIFKYCEVP